MRIKKSLLAIIMLAITFIGKSQSTELPRLGIFKFHPFTLGENTLSVGYEVFNLKRKNSWQVNLGITYLDNQSPVSFNNIILENFNSQKGLVLALERRIYITDLHEFKTKKGNTNNRYGIYFSPFICAENQKTQSQNDSYNNYDQIKQTTLTTPILVENRSSAKVFAYMPGFTIGFQTSVWDVLYVDLYAGAGIRIVENKTSTSTSAYLGSYNNYNSYNLLDSGIRPKIGFAIGIKL